MRILCRSYDVHEPAAGSAVVLRAIVGFLREQGDDVWAVDGPLDVAEVAGWRPDLIVAQQWATGEATRWATDLRVPFVMLVHGPGQYEHFMPQCDLVVFNAERQRALAADALGRTPSCVLNVPDASDPGHDAGTDVVSIGSGGGESLDALRERLAAIAAGGRRRPTITLCMTVANEGATLTQAIDSAAPFVDEILIGVDAKSTDETESIARTRATRTFAYDESRPPDFPRMRNRAMARVETDWALVLDGHEWIEHADQIREAVETDAWSIEIQTLFEPDEQRVPALSFPFPRLHRRHVRFVGAAAHEEVSTPLDRRVARLDIQVWHERRPGAAADARAAEKSGAELQRLREAWEQQGDRRALFYLANGLRGIGEHDAAVAAYREYLRAPNFADEGWQARLYLARCEAARGAQDAAEREFEALVAASPDRAEGVVGLAHAVLARGDARRAAAWFRMATALAPPRDCRMFVEVPVYRWGAWHGLALALHALHDDAGAAEAESRAAAGGAGEWARANVAWWRARATAGQAGRAGAGGLG